MDKTLISLLSLMFISVTVNAQEIKIEANKARFREFHVLK